MVPEERDRSQGSWSAKRGSERDADRRPRHRHAVLDFSSPAGSLSLWDKMPEGLGDRGLCSPVTPSSRKPGRKRNFAIAAIIP